MGEPDQCLSVFITPGTSLSPQKLGELISRLKHVERQRPGLNVFDNPQLYAFLSENTQFAEGLLNSYFVWGSRDFIDSFVTPMRQTGTKDWALFIEPGIADSNQRNNSIISIGQRAKRKYLREWRSHFISRAGMRTLCQ